MDEAEASVVFTQALSPFERRARVAVGGHMDHSFRCPVPRATRWKGVNPFSGRHAVDAHPLLGDVTNCLTPNRSSLWQAESPLRGLNWV